MPPLLILILIESGVLAPSVASSLSSSRSRDTRVCRRIIPELYVFHRLVAVVIARCLRSS
jgi:hypothetical protein